MNKSQLIEALSSHFEGNKRSAQHALESVLGTITREVARGEKVAITGFGAFEKTLRPSRMVRNPRTGERTRAKKTAVPKFRAGAHLKDVVSGARKVPKVAPATATKTTSATSGTTPSKKSAPARKSTAAKSTSSAATKKTAAKTLAKKSSSPAAKKSAAKTLAKKSTPARKSTAKKTTPKKS